MIRRLQLFEFEDLSWFPDVLRRAMTRYLRTAFGLFGFHRFWAEELASLGPQGGGVFRIVDLGSGSGGPIPSIIPELRRKGYSPKVTLTDLYPNPEFFSSEIKIAGINEIQYWPSPVDAACVPSKFAGVRTMFLSFHHHPPERARAILRDAFDKRVGIAVFEGTSRRPVMVLSCMLIPVFVLFVTPTIRPLKFSQLLFTYLIPLAPVFIFWDGLVSCLRTYSVADLEQMTAEMQSPDYIWKIGIVKLPKGGGAFPWLTGRPL
jgi:hypothetical protein